MKRLDLIELIQNEYNLADGLAEDIVKLIEKCGMLPPLRDKIANNQYVGYSNIQVPEWDEE